MEPDQNKDAAQRNFDAKIAEAKAGIERLIEPHALPGAGGVLIIALLELGIERHLNRFPDEKGRARPGEWRSEQSAEAQERILMAQELILLATKPAAAATHIGIVVPAVISDAGEHAARRFLEFFAATIRNKNTRMAYYRAACHFFAWVEQHQIGGLADIEPIHVAAYIEVLLTTAAKPTVKLHLAAIRMLFDWLVVGQVLAVNPAHAVRGPKHVVRRGKTPVLTEEQARRLLESLDTSTLVGLRDRALIGVMTYAFARIGAVVAMKVEDYYPAGKRWWVRLHEKGGKRHEMPAHHKLEQFIDEYLAAAGIGGKFQMPQ